MQREGQRKWQGEGPGEAQKGEAQTGSSALSRTGRV
jgi:hypothetical protein